MPSKTILIQSEGLGRGDDKLGGVLLTNFLRTLGEGAVKPKAIIFWNTGVRLLCEGSELIVLLKWLEGQGIEILGCTTCLRFFGLEEKLAVGKPTTMPIIVGSVMNTDMVCL
jgi:selenium metabolism protein YedF